VKKKNTMEKEKKRRIDVERSHIHIPTNYSGGGLKMSEFKN
jgi:hypothetical protein